jgi:glycosyltransferase involved in cell wall biosynthesis
MKIAFYAPMKPPDHPVPSGDRQMARALMRALALAGFDVVVASRFRSYSAKPAEQALAEHARPELDRLLAMWRDANQRPGLWITYHPYYRAPDFLGPEIAGRLDIPYVTIEASYAGKRDRDAWSEMQAAVVRGIEAAALNICFTAADREGLSRIVGDDRLADLPPFIDAQSFATAERGERHGPVRLLTVAMMRGGVKLQSYDMLGRALSLIANEPWILTVVGDGPERPRVEAAFAGFPSSRVSWAGETPPEAVVRHLSEADVFVWPGTGEAYGIAYLEAQAAGLPVVAQATHGVPAVVRHGETGLLTTPGDDRAYAEAIAKLIHDERLRQGLGRAARRFVHSERSLPAAAARLRGLLEPLLSNSEAP